MTVAKVSGVFKQVAAVAGVLALTACGSSSGGEATPSPSPTPTPTAQLTVKDLTLGVWGTPAEVAAFTTAAKAYDDNAPLSSVAIKTWATDAAMMTEFAQPDAELPDVFLISRADLTNLENNKQVMPLGDFLDARGVDIGDEYSRDAMEALSAGVTLECMPYGISPKVVYYNTDIIDFARMAKKGIETPNVTSSKSWKWDHFQLAMQEAQGFEGVTPFALDPSLTGLSPFLVGAGGSLDNEDGTAISLSDEANLDALGKILPVLSNPDLTSTMAPARQLKQFANGKLAMMVADRSVVPALRAAEKIRWDVLPMPTIEAPATTGDYTALCISASTENAEVAADLLVSLISEEGYAPMMEAGSVVPVNQKVALSDSFIQLDKAPLHSSVYPYTVRHMQVLPFAAEFPAIEAAVKTDVHALLKPGQIPVAVTAIASQIDANAASVLPAPIDEDAEPTETPAP